MNRIDFISSLINESNTLTDVGCDHGYVALNALKENKVKFAYLLDINEGPLLNAKSNLKDYQDKTKFIISDGLLNYDDDKDTLIIAGMGGLLIIDILKKSLDKVKKFKHIILEAQNENNKLRAFLISNKFRFIDEHFIEDNNRYYEIIECVYDESNNKTYDLLDMKFGPILRTKENPLFDKFYQTRKKDFEKFLTQTKDLDAKSKLKIQIAFINMLEFERKKR